MENPLRRLRRTLNLTQSDLASLANVTTNAVIKNEQGLYPEPSEKLVNALLSELGSDSPVVKTSLYLDYYAFRANQLNRASSYFNTPVAKHLTGFITSKNTHPFVTYRVDVLHFTSRLAFCKLLVLHPAVVQKYEDAQMRSMPHSVYSTLKTVGVSLSALNYLNYLGEVFYDRAVEKAIS